MGFDGRAVTRFSIVLGTALALVACSSTTSGRGSRGDAVASGTTSAAASSSPDFPGSTAPSSGAAAGGCVAGADYCDTFDDPTSGWAVDNPAHYYAHYDDFLGGSYRMGERTNAAISEDAPFDITDAAGDYSVQVDTDATLGQGFGGTNEIGLVCWEHEIEGSGGTTTAFLLEIGLTRATIGLWDGADGSYHEITSEPAGGALTRSGANHLTGQCIQDTSHGSPQARLSLLVNGTQVISTTYDKSVQNLRLERRRERGIAHDRRRLGRLLRQLRGHRQVCG